MRRVLALVMELALILLALGSADIAPVGQSSINLVLNLDELDHFRFGFSSTRVDSSRPNPTEITDAIVLSVDESEWDNENVLAGSGSAYVWWDVFSKNVTAEVWLSGPMMLENNEAETLGWLMAVSHGDGSVSYTGEESLVRYESASASPYGSHITVLQDDDAYYRIGSALVTLTTADAANLDRGRYYGTVYLEVTAD